MQSWIQLPFNLLVIFSILVALCILFLIISFHVTLKICKKGPLIEGYYKISWLGLTLKRKEILPQSADNFIGHFTEKEDSNKGDDKSIKSKIVGRKDEDIRKIEDQKEKHKQDSLRPSEVEFLLDTIPALWKVFRDLLKSIEFQNISCRLCFGLEDPANTAILSGYFWSMASILSIFRANISIEPYFERRRLEGEFFSRLRTRPLWTLWHHYNAIRERKIRRLLINVVRRA